MKLDLAIRYTDDLQCGFKGWCSLPVHPFVDCVLANSKGIGHLRNATLARFDVLFERHSLNIAHYGQYVNGRKVPIIEQAYDYDLG